MQESKQKVTESCLPYIKWQKSISSPLKVDLDYGKCPKILDTKLANKMAYANSADPDKTEEQSDQGPYSLPFN